MITAKSNEFVVDYSDQLLSDVFVFQPTSGNADNSLSKLSFDDSVLQIGTQKVWLERVATREHPASLLLAAAQLTDPTSISVLQTLADNNCQIFLLLGDDKQNLNAIEALSGRCCIRTGVVQSGMLIITEPTVETKRYGLVCSSGFTGLDHYGYSLVLQTTQIDDYYRLFCHLFWKQARFEYLEQGRKQPCVEEQAPVTNIPLRHEHVLPKKLPEHLNNALTGQNTILSNCQTHPENLWQMISTDSLDLSTSQLLMSLQQIKSPHLHRLTHATQNIALIDTPLLPQVLASGECNWLLPLEYAPDSIAWAVKLTDDQSTSLADFQYELQQSERWDYVKEITVRALEAPLRHLNAIDTPVQYTAQKTINLGELECGSFDDFENLPADELACKYNLTHFKLDDQAKTICYHINITPPSLPNNAAKDSLYQQWSDIQAQWNINVANLEDRHQRLKNEQNQLTDKIKGFMGGFLVGRLNTNRKTEKTLRALREIELASLSPASREEQLQTINDVAGQLFNEGEAFAQEVDKAEQLKHWDEQRLKLNEAYKNAEAVMKSAEKTFKDFQQREPDNIQTIDHELETKWHTWLTSLIEQNLQPRVSLPKTVKELCEWIPNNLDSLEGSFAIKAEKQDAVLTQRWLSFLERFYSTKDKEEERQAMQNYTASEIRVWLDSPPNPSSKMKKAIAEIKKADSAPDATIIKNARISLQKLYKAHIHGVKSLEHEAQKLQMKLNHSLLQLRSVQDEIGQHEQKKRTIKPEAQKGLLAKLFGAKESNTMRVLTLSFPTEDLPKVGTLFRAKGLRYLAIQNEDEIEQGKKTAVQFKAHLVVIKETYSG